MPESGVIAGDLQHKRGFELHEGMEAAQMVRLMGCRYRQTWKQCMGVQHPILFTGVSCTGCRLGVKGCHVSV